MTHQEIVNRMKTDPAFVVSFIVQNNPKRVYENMLANGIVTSFDPSRMYTDLMKFASKNPGAAMAILNVPIRETEDQEHLTEAVKDSGIFQPITTKSGSANAEDGYMTDYFDDWEDRPTDVEDFEAEETGGNWNWDWLGNFFGSLGGVFSALTPGQQQQPADDSQTNKSNTTMIIVIVLVIAVVVGGILFLKK